MGVDGASLDDCGDASSTMGKSWDLDTAGDSLDFAGEALDIAGEALGIAGEALEAAGEARGIAGEAVDRTVAIAPENFDPPLVEPSPMTRAFCPSGLANRPEECVSAINLLGGRLAIFERCGRTTTRAGLTRKKDNTPITQ